MNASELVDHVRDSHETTLRLVEPINFRRRTRSNPVDFEDFLQAIEENDTAQAIVLSPELLTNLSENAVERFLRSLGGLSGIETIRVEQRTLPVVQLPVSTLARILRLCRLNLRDFLVDVRLRGDQVDYAHFAQAIHSHPTLEEFACPLPPSLEHTLSDPIITALTTCSKLEGILLDLESPVSDGCLRSLLLIPTLRRLGIFRQTRQGRCQWDILANTLSDASCGLESLFLVDWDADLDACLALARSIQVNPTLQTLMLCPCTGFHDAFAIALAEALKVNRSIKTLVLRAATSVRHQAISESALKAFIEMLRVNHEIFVYSGDGHSSIISPWLGNLVDPTQAVQLRPLLRKIFLEMCLNACCRRNLGNRQNRLDWIHMLSSVAGIRGIHGETLGECCRGLTIKFETPLTDDELDCVELECLSCILKMNPTVCSRSS